MLYIIASMLYMCVIINVRLLINFQLFHTITVKP